MEDYYFEGFKGLKHMTNSELIDIIYNGLK